MRKGSRRVRAQARRVWNSGSGWYPGRANMSLFVGQDWNPAAGWQPARSAGWRSASGSTGCPTIAPIPAVDDLASKGHGDWLGMELRRTALAFLKGVRSIPLHRLPQSNVERRPCPKPKFPLRAAHVQTPPRLPVGLGSVPNIRPGKPVMPAILTARSRIEISIPLPKFTGSGLS